MGKKLNKGLFYIFIGLLCLISTEAILLFLYNPPPQIIPLVNKDSMLALTFLKRGIGEEVAVSTKSKGKIIKIVSKNTTPQGFASVKIIVFGISSDLSQEYAFTKETLKVTSVFDKNNQPILFSSLKVGDNIEIGDTINLVGDCANDICTKKVVIKVK